MMTTTIEALNSLSAAERHLWSDGYARFRHEVSNRFGGAWSDKGFTFNEAAQQFIRDGAVARLDPKYDALLRKLMSVGAYVPRRHPHMTRPDIFGVGVPTSDMIDSNHDDWSFKPEFLRAVLEGTELRLEFGDPKAARAKAAILELEGLTTAETQRAALRLLQGKPEPEPLEETTLATKQTCWDIISAVLPHTKRVLLWGPPGTGKTHAGIYEGLLENQQVYSIYITEYTPVSEPRGNIFPVVEEGQRVYRWQDGPAILAYRNGGRLVVNEIDKASDDCMTFFLALFDDESVSRITLPTGEIVERHPNFSVVATTNARPIALIDPLRDRFTVTINVDIVNPRAISHLPEGIRSTAQATANADVLEDRIGIRAWNEFVSLRQHVGDDMAGGILFGSQKTTVLQAVAAKELALKMAAEQAAEKAKTSAAAKASA